MGLMQEAMDSHGALLKATAEALGAKIDEAGKILVEAFRKGGKAVLFGNGGSAADALHMEGELLGRFRKDREGLPAIALGGGIGAFTAIANDYSYAEAYARMVRAHTQSRDVVLLFSTSGNSENIVQAARAAQDRGARVVAFTGRTGGRLKEHADLLLDIPSEDTPRIQEMHILLIHILCEIVEQAMFE